MAKRKKAPLKMRVPDEIEVNGITWRLMKTEVVKTEWVNPGVRARMPRDWKPEEIKHTVFVVNPVFKYSEPHPARLEKFGRAIFATEQAARTARSDWANRDWR